jgi:phosphomannomutase
VHAGDQVSRRVTDLADIAAMMRRLRSDLPAELAGEPVEATDLADLRGQSRTDAVVLAGPTVRMVVRPSGTEPKLKCYLEVVVPAPDRSALPAARAAAAARLNLLREFAEAL